MILTKFDRKSTNNSLKTNSAFTSDFICKKALFEYVGNITMLKNCMAIPKV